MKCNNIHTIEIPEGEEKEQGIEKLFEKMTENIHNLVNENVMRAQKAQRVPIKMNPKMPIPRPTIIKLGKFKDKVRICLPNMILMGKEIKAT